MPKLKEPIQISRVGRATATNGMVIDFTDPLLAGVAKGYDPAKYQAPLVIGHPQMNAPAYGWVRSLDYAGGVLRVPEVVQLDPAFADLVNAGRYKTVSASFFLPDSPNNPTPGQMALRHVGFLGAVPPAVKGLKPAQFADGDALTVEFAAVDGWTLSSALGLVGSILGGVRDLFVETQGAEKAEAVLPRQHLDDLQAAAERVRQQASDRPAPGFSDSPPTPKDDLMTEEELKAREAELAKRESAVAAQEAAFADAARKAVHRDNEALLDGLIQDGRFRPTQKAVTLAFMDGLDAASATIDFADADGKVRKVSQLDAYREQLKAAPKLVEFGEHPKAGEDLASVADFAAPAGFVVDPDRAQLHARAVAYQAAHPGTDYLVAVKAVGGK